MKVRIENDACIGCGLCVSLCSGAFKIGESGRSELKTDNFDNLESEIKNCVDACPVNAIKVQE